MVWLYIVLAMLALFLLFMLIPMGLIIVYNGDLNVKIKIFGFKFNLKSKMNTNTNKRKIANKNPKSSLNLFKDLIKKKGALELIQSFSKILSSSMKIFKKLMNKVSFKKLKLLVAVGANDAMEASVRYGQISAVVYPLASVINNIKEPKELILEVIPRFLNENISINFEIDVSSSILNLIRVLWQITKDFKKEFL